MTPPQIGRELARARVDEMHRQAARQRMVHAARARMDAATPGPARTAGWLIRVVQATLRL